MSEPWRLRSARSRAARSGMSTTLAVIVRSAPRSTSRFVASTLLNAAANIKGVCSHWDSLASIPAPWSSKVVTVRALPAAAAKWRGVAAPVDVIAFGSAPASNNVSAARPRPALLAKCNGV